MKTQIITTPQHSIKCANNLHFLGFCLVMITACSVFKEKSFYETDSLQREQVNREVKSQSIATSESLRIYSSRDSADQQSYAEIYPKGTFKYSAKEGFSGEAERLVINERLRFAQERSGALRLMQSKKVRTAMKEATKSRTHTSLKEKQEKPLNLSWFYLVGCGLIFVGIWWFRRRW